ncbi:hypothetical protein [Micromonospora sp. 4G55]|uniref:hypothetical protein n=1 Tax=Micromonospora sp. 4G55 TaxID=2806102 RepID=UPI001A3ABCED|nr:hypothetical protein [Micromonospora sp. 4G55]MBM0256361.1 hypothetical protein [Micromonospora sp. 4G55]
MTPLTPEDIALFVSETDQDKAAVRQLAALVRRHWTDDSGCPLPKCPSGSIARQVEKSSPEHIRHLFLSALVLLAEQQQERERQHTPGWAVVDDLGVRHDFTGPEKAMRYAIDRAYTDRSTELESPTGDRWVLLRRHPDVVIVAARKVKTL